MMWLMTRARVLVLVAGVILVASLAVAMALPRYDCPGRSRLVDTRDEVWTDADYTCEEVERGGQMIRVMAYDVFDRTALKLGLAIGGVSVGAVLAAVAFTRARRGRAASVALTGG